MENVFSDRITFKPTKRNPLSSWFDRATRRSIDIFVAIFGILLLSPIFAFIAVLIKMDSPGPVFYRGPRLGRGGTPFGILKFRTMYETPASYAGARITASTDTRITPFGRWLRDTKVNELPQLWNVLIGEMSLVGPRPEDPVLAADWPEDFKNELLKIRPGVTSPASIFYRDEENMLAGDNVLENYLHNILPSKLRMDLLYIRSRTILSDLDVILWTALELLPQIRKQSVPQHALIWGPLARFVSHHMNWFAVDFFVVLASFSVSAVAWRISRPLHIGFWQTVMVCFGIAILFSFINYLIGLNRISWSKAPANSALELMGSTVLATFVVLGIDRILFPPETLPFTLLIVSSSLSALGFMSVRYRERLITGLATRWLGERSILSNVGERVLIIGAGELGEFATLMFKRGDFAKAFSVIGVVDDDPRKVGMSVDRCRILGTTEELPELIEKHGIGVVVFAITTLEERNRQRIINLTERSKARLIMFPNIFGNLKTYMHLDHRLLQQDLNKRIGRLRGEPIQAWYDELDQLIAAGNTLRAQELLQHIRREFASSEVRVGELER